MVVPPSFPGSHHNLLQHVPMYKTNCVANAHKQSTHRVRYHSTGQKVFIYIESKLVCPTSHLRCEGTRQWIVMIRAQQPA